MPILQSHDCIKCGAALAVDTEKQLYVCPYCGKTYKYEYFAEGNLLDFAYEALFKRDFETAKDAFSFMLVKEPQNFSALRGHLFASYQVSSLETFDVLKNNLNSGNKDLQACLQNTEERGREYFTTLSKAGDIAIEYKEQLQKQNAVIAEEQRVLNASARWEKRLNIWNEGLFMHYFFNNTSEEADFFLFLATVCLLVAAALFTAFFFGTRVLLISSAIAYFLWIALYILIKALRKKQLLKKVLPFRLKCMELKADYRLLGKEAEKLKDDYWDALLSTTLIDPDPRF
ncbi:MAG: hypothetical protein J5752_10125 [Clostridiales bacterium]|nr:hypothetical protein [Clostridiales bacterium]